MCWRACTNNDRRHAPFVDHVQRASLLVLLFLAPFRLINLSFIVSSMSLGVPSYLSPYIRLETFVHIYIYASLAISNKHARVLPINIRSIYIQRIYVSRREKTSRGDNDLLSMHNFVHHLHTHTHASPHEKAHMRQRSGKSHNFTAKFMGQQPRRTKTPCVQSFAYTLINSFCARADADEISPKKSKRARLGFMDVLWLCMNLF